MFVNVLTKNFKMFLFPQISLIVYDQHQGFFTHMDPMSYEVREFRLYSRDT